MRKYTAPLFTTSECKIDENGLEFAIRGIASR